MPNRWIEFVKRIQFENNISYKDALILSKSLYQDDDLINGGNLEETGKLLKPFFNRIGSKVPIINEVLNAIPPHEIYVELFLGGGAVFWNKSPAKHSVINDLDKDLIEGYKILKRISKKAKLGYLDNEKPINGSYPTIDKFINNINKNSSDSDKLVALFKRLGGTDRRLYDVSDKK